MPFLKTITQEAKLSGGDFVCQEAECSGAEAIAFSCTAPRHSCPQGQPAKLFPLLDPEWTESDSICPADCCFLSLYGWSVPLVLQNDPSPCEVARSLSVPYCLSQIQTYLSKNMFEWFWIFPTRLSLSLYA